MPPASPPAPTALTPHAPVGAWTSFSFGTPFGGLAIQIDSLDPRPPRPNADLLIALQRDGITQALPFIQDPTSYPGWQFLEPQRSLTPCIDSFSAPAAGITLRVLTPHAALPNPKRSGNLQFATAPGILLELTLDNSLSDSPATAFVGIRSAATLRALDWSSKTLVGIASNGGGPGSGGGANWLLAVSPVKDEIATRLADDITQFVPQIDPTAHTGGIVIRVAPRTSKTLHLVLAAYVPGSATHGIEGRYFYANYFPRLETVANFLLQNAQRVRESCTNFDARLATTCPDPVKQSLFARAVRTYNAATQLVDSATPAGPAAYFATIAPDGTRNSLDRIADRLPWELYRNPWVIRNVFDLATSTYAYHDQLRFSTDPSPDELHPGGMTFARNFGYAAAYAPGNVPPGTTGTAFDGRAGAAGAATGGPGWSGGARASEILLNAIYMLTSYALIADDTPWAKTRLPFARELMVSLENRDHWDPAQRTGILQAESASSNGPEETAFADLPGADASLSPARGNLYLALKTFCANLLLTTYYQNNNDLHSADFSYAFAQRTAAALVAAFNPQTQSLPANLLTPSTPGLLLAALEPLALPTYLGLTSTLPEYFPELYAALKAHAQTCLAHGCLDGTTLRLSSTSPVTDPNTTISLLYLLERLFQIDVPNAPAIWENLATTGNPGAITAALYLKA